MTFLNTFRGRLLLILALLLITTLGVQYYLNLLTQRQNNDLREAQTRALVAGIAIGSNGITSSEYMQAFSFRLRGREKFLMDKIELALRKIDDGTYGTCEECEETIALKRLQARPEAPLCIQCKEAQEKEEAVYAEE